MNEHPNIHETSTDDMKHDNETDFIGSIEQVLRLVSKIPEPVVTLLTQAVQLAVNNPDMCEPEDIENTKNALAMLNALHTFQKEIIRMTEESEDQK